MAPSIQSAIDPSLASVTPLHWHLSLTIFKLVTRISPASEPPSFFSFSAFSPFSFSYDSALNVPVTVTLWPRCLERSTAELLRSYLLPSSPVMENSSASSPFCKQPVTVFFSLAFFVCANPGVVPHRATTSETAPMTNRRADLFTLHLLKHRFDERRTS